MKTLKCIFLIITLVLLLAIGEVYAGSLKIKQQGSTKLSTMLNNIPVVVITNTTKYSSQSIYNSGFRWGVDTKPPEWLLTSMNITIGSREVFVPLSAYCDLANPYEIFLTEKNKGFSITIYGGQTATSYKAEIIVQDGYIQRRKVSHGEFPNVAWEETVYSYNLGD